MKEIISVAKNLTSLTPLKKGKLTNGTPANIQGIDNLASLNDFRESKERIFNNSFYEASKIMTPTTRPRQHEKDAYKPVSLMNIGEKKVLRKQNIFFNSKKDI